MRALILGGNGFIGSHVLDALMAHGHRVRVFDRLPDRFRSAVPGVEYRYGSIEDGPALAEAMTGMDVVFHLVSTSLPGTSNLDPVADIEGNLVSSVRLLDQMLKAGISRILFFSSGGTVYGNPTVSPVPETHALRPICSYGVVKVAIENYLSMYQDLNGLRPVVLRPSNPVGPRQGHIGVQGLVPTILRRLLEGEPIQIWGDGSVVRDYIDVGDLAALAVGAAESREVGVFNAGSGIGRTVREVVETVQSVTGRSGRIEFLPGRAFDVKSIVLDATRAQRTFGWRAATPFEDSIRRAWDWMQDAAR